jgi:hypothetical protein
MLNEGQLYKVNDYALSMGAHHLHANKRIVRDHGYLWIREGERDGAYPDSGYLCRSLATGETENFYPDELEAADGEG